MSSVFYILDLVVNGLIFLGFSYRYQQTKVRYYLWVALAVLAEAVSSALLVFLTGVGDLSAIIIYVALILVTLSGLVFVMAVVFLFRDWIQSMQNSAQPQAHKLAKAEKVINILKYVYPGLTFLLVLVYVLLLSFLFAAGFMAIIVAVAYTAAVIVQLAFMVWLLLDIQSVSDESMMQKRNQLVRIVALTFFASWPALLGGVGTGVGVAVCWWLWYGIALWPNSLVGYDEPPAWKLDTGFGAPVYPTHPDPVHGK